jgi:flagellar basal-body rod protein FlgB
LQFSPSNARRKRKKEEIPVDPNGIFGGNIPLLERALDLRAQRHHLLAANAANMDTPHYKAFDVMVEEAMEEMEETVPSSAGMRRTHPAHLDGKGGGETPLPVQEMPLSGNTSGVQGNTVDIDRVMSAMTANGILYSASSQILARKFQGIRNAIQGGGK